MDRFDVFLKKLLKLEGGYVNHKNDKGGCTNYGVTIATYRKYYGEHLTCSNLKNITTDELRKIYKEGYWNPCWGDRIVNDSVAEIIVDWAVNSGVKTAIKGVQKIIGTTVDGIMGPKTLKAINEYDSQKLFNDLKESRKDFYKRIVEKNPSQKVFLKGWLNRLNDYQFII